MQRIDENTYIDDTLVTCAEYQLFIDEMREQGKYYQPDHWTSYQFPEGKAREPILGVRHSDAVTFCEWLTQRGTGEWVYRLPTQEKAENFPMKHLKPSHFGYWLDEDYQFAWVGSIPNNARFIDLNFLSDMTNALNLVTDFNLTNYINLALDLDRPIALASKDYFIASAFRSDRTIDFDHALPYITHRIFNRSLDYLHQGPNGEIDTALEIYMDIYTLQERIAGRSPAFEGIRLVKYRENPETLSDIGNSPT